MHFIVIKNTHQLHVSLERGFELMLKARCLIGQYLMSFQLIGRERHLASINLKTSLSRIDINLLTNMQYNIAILTSLYQHRYTHSEYIFT